MAKKTIFLNGPWIRNLTYTERGTAEIVQFSDDGDGSYYKIAECRIEVVDIVIASPDILKSLESMKWFVDHIMDAKAKRVDWGKTFGLDWERINDTLIELDAALKKAKGE